MRDAIVKDWTVELQNNSLPCGETFQMPEILSDAMTIQDWNLAGLPSDQVSICNAIIIDRSKR